MVALNACVPLSLITTSFALRWCDFGSKTTSPSLCIVNDPLHVLPIGTEIASNARRGSRVLGTDAGAEDLPPRARQIQIGDQAVARSQ